MKNLCVGAVCVLAACVVVPELLCMSLFCSPLQWKWKGERRRRKRRRQRRDGVQSFGFLGCVCTTHTHFERLTHPPPTSHPHPPHSLASAHTIFVPHSPLTLFLFIEKMGHTNGYRRGTRYMFQRGFRKHGTLSLTRYLTTYKVGDIVDIKVRRRIQS